MKRVAMWGTTFGLLLAIVLFAPAAWLAQSIASQTDGKVRLLAPRGTVWAGSAALVLSGGEGSQGAIAMPSRLSWSILPSGLGLQLALSAPCCIPSTPLHIALQTEIASRSATGLNFQLDAAALHIPADVLAGLGAPWNTLQLAGELQISSQAFKVAWSIANGVQSIEGHATLNAKDLQTSLSTVRPLGTYLVTLQGHQLTLSTPSSTDALQLSGTGELGASARFLGTAIASAGREAALSNLLHIIGQRQMGEQGQMRSILQLGSTP